MTTRSFIEMNLVIFEITMILVDDKEWQQILFRDDWRKQIDILA